MRRAAKVDRNHAEVVAALRGVGASVQSLAAVGSGCPDLLVGHRGKNYLFEVKDGSAAPSAQKLRPAQVEWLRAWAGEARVVLCPEDALRFLCVELRGGRWTP